MWLAISIFLRRILPKAHTVTSGEQVLPESLIAATHGITNGPAVHATVENAAQQGEPPANPPPEPPKLSETPTPPTPLTPHTWLAKQAPEDTIFIYIDTVTYEMLELRSQPRHQLAKVFNIPMYRDPAAQWRSAGANCLMRVTLDPAIKRAKFEKAVEDLLFLHSAREHLSTELASLDRVIADLYTALTQPTQTPRQAVPDLPDLPAALWVSVLRHTKERVPVAANWQLLGAFLRQRQETSAEMAEVDKDLLPALESFGVNHDK